MELQQELKLKQTLSQNMILSAQILQMGQLELKEYLENLALENPVVDLEEKKPEKEEGNEDFIRRLEELQSIDRQNRQYYEEEEEEAGRFEPGSSTEQDLEESLLEQLLCLKLSKEEYRILKYMIMNLDDSGYLTCDFNALCGGCQISEEEGLRVLKILQTLEPKGVGARNLKECLLLQLDAADVTERTAELAKKIVEDYLEDLGKNRMEQLAKRLKCRLEEVLAAARLIKGLNPRPGNAFSGGSYERYLVPDVLVVKGENGYQILLNDESYPQLTINPYYVSLMKSGVSEEAENYIKDKVRQAEWACRCVEQRNKTLYLLAEEILRVQQGFFENGRAAMAVLTQKSVAEKLGLNESTISRAVREKYLQCRWGIFPLQYFFSRGKGNGDAREMAEKYGPVRGDSISDEAKAAGAADSTAGSAEAVKERLRRIIESENKKKPYSDRILAERLEEEGIKISRRTVAKYREAIGIPDASGRKVFE